MSLRDPVSTPRHSRDHPKTGHFQASKRLLGRKSRVSTSQSHFPKTTFLIYVALISGLGLGLAACASESANNGQRTVTNDIPPVTNTHYPTPSSKVSPTLPSTPTHLPAASPTPTPYSPDVCIYAGHFHLSRPIAPSGVDVIDPTYRYGSTQDGLRETHHGVEFVNPQGTPVLAAADGMVIVAGDDYQIPYANYPGFYGNLVILEHALPEVEGPIFTLYGHLYDVQVEIGQQVKTGDQIGEVGFTGWATGEHLHFEVRYGANSYRETRNPELWLRPHHDENNEPHGAIAGQIIDEFGTPIYNAPLTIEQISPENGEILAAYYLETYADWTVNGDDNLGENFVLGDLPAGHYRVSFVARGLQVYDVEVQPGQVTMIVFDAREQGE